MTSLQNSDGEKVSYPYNTSFRQMRRKFSSLQIGNKLNNQTQKADKQLRIADVIELETELCRKKLMDVQNQNTHLQKEIKDKEEELEGLSTKLSDMRELYEYVIRYETKLYYNLSKITWDLDKMPGEIAGYTTLNNNLKMFTFKVSECDQFEIANHLWNLLEPSIQPL